MSEQGHIRPKIRRSRAPGTTNSATTADESKEVTQPQATTPASSLPKARAGGGGILKPPKYGTTGSGANNVKVQQELLLRQKQLPKQKEGQPTTPSLPPAAVRDVVVERPRRNRRGRGDNSTTATQTNPPPIKEASANSSVAAAVSIEGYAPTATPTTATFATPTATLPQEQSTIDGPAATSTGTTQKEGPAPVNNNASNATLSHNEQKKTEALILNSLADLLETTSVVPLPDADTPVTTETAVVEADLQFSVMAPETYQQQQTEERQEQFEIMMGRQPYRSNASDKENMLVGRRRHADQEGEDVPGPQNDEDDDNPSGHDNPDEEAVEDDDSMDDYFDNDNMSEDDDDDDDPTAPREPRAFLILWSALTQWVTPQSVQWIQNWRNLQQQVMENNNGNDPTATTVDVSSLPTQAAVDRTDLGVSRCAGLMAILQMHFNAALDELGLSLEDRRRTERLVGDLLRTFDYRRPSPKLSVAQSKALTAILLQTVVYADDAVSASDTNADGEVILPESCQGLGLTSDEFRYLTVSAIPNLVTPPPVA